MEKTRFAIISDLLQLSHGIRASLKVADGLACDGSKDESVRKEAFREIKRNLKAVPLCLSGIRDYIAEHDDRDLARQFVALLDDTKRLHDFCVALHPELKAEAYRSGIAYATMEVIGQYFFPDKDTDKGTDGKRKPMTRAEATDCIDIIRATIRKCTAMADANKGKEDVASEAYTSLAHIGRNEIEAVKEYITNANDKDLAALFTEDFTKAVHLSVVFRNGNPKTQSAGIKMFHISLTMGYVERNILHENTSKPTAICKEEAQSAFMGADSTMGETFTTTAQVPVLRLYQFLTTFTVQSGPDKGKPVLDGNAVSDKDFIRSVMRADYSMIYANGVKGKLRCTVTLISRAYFKDWKEYRKTAAESIGLTVESLAKYNVERAFIAKLKELMPMIK